MTESPYIAPKLTLRVGVTGHRPGKLAVGDIKRVEQQASAVVSCLAQIAQDLHSENSAMGPDAPFEIAEPDLRFVTALAEGADRICAIAALSQGFGLNVIMPFPKAIYTLDFENAALEQFHDLCTNSAVRSITELNVSETPHDPKAYRAAGLLTLAHSDIVIAVWNKSAADGIGGTAEIVEEAQRRGLIIVLITPEGDTSLWDAPANVIDPLACGSWKALTLEPGMSNSTDILATKVRERIAFPAAGRLQTGVLDNESELSPTELLKRFRNDHTRETTVSIGYELLRWLYGIGTSFPWRVDTGLKRERSKSWPLSLQVAESVGGASFRDQIDQRVRERWIRADNLAVSYSHMFRTAFVVNFSLAALAVFIGLISVFFWDNKTVKAILVSLELITITAILINTHLGKRGRWRDNWLDYRGLAESIRPTRLPLLVASSPIRSGVDTIGTPGRTWAAWYTRAALREIAPPTALIGPEELKMALNVAIDEEIDGQIDYHKGNAEKLHQLEHRLEVTADVALYGTIAVGAIYIVTWAVYQFYHESPVHFFKPIATLLGGTLPVIGAAIFGIRATGDFRSAMRQSERMQAELHDLRVKLDTQRNSPAPDRSTVRLGLTLVSHAMADDLKVWGLIYSERDLTQGF